MAKVYFVRHAKPDFSIVDDLIRPLTEEGLSDSKKVTEFLLDKNIKSVYSSPYKRAIDTVKDFAESMNCSIKIVDNFRERKIDNTWIDDFKAFAKEQWNDFGYKLTNGESLSEVQNRNIVALHSLLEEHKEDNIVIGTHGTAMSTIINYYDKNFDYKQFERIAKLMPFIVCMEFKNRELVKVDEFIL